MESNKADETAWSKVRVAGTSKERPLSISWSEPGASLAHARNRPVSPLLAKGGGRKPFVQGWTHTSRRVRRFFQKPVAGVIVMPLLDI